MTGRMLAYDRRANSDWISKLIDLGSRCPEKAKRLMSHILNAQHIWLSRMADHETEVRPFDVHEPSEWEGLLDRNHRSFKAILSSESLEDTFGYETTSGQTYSNRQDDTLLHVLLHGQYHRGQIASLVKAETGESVPTDYIFYLR